MGCPPSGSGDLRTSQGYYAPKKKTHKWLILGEEDFSFSRALATEKPSGVRITATAFGREEYEVRDIMLKQDDRAAMSLELDRIYLSDWFSCAGEHVEVGDCPCATLQSYRGGVVLKPDGKTA
eukprot:gene30-1186_t